MAPPGGAATSTTSASSKRTWRIFQRQFTAGTPLTLVGFSAGGGLGLRIAAGPLAERYVLPTPPLRFGSRAARPPGGHYSVAPRRILGLYALNALGIHALDALVVLAFGLPPDKARAMTGSYSFRLPASFGPHWDALDDLRRST